MRMHLILIALMLSIVTHVYSQEMCSQPTQELPSVSDIKDRLIDEMTKDLPVFCQWNRMDRFVRGFTREIQGEYQKLKDKNDIEGAGNLLSKKVDSLPSPDPWALSMTGHPKIKGLAPRYSYLVSCSKTVGLNCPAATNEELKNAIIHPFINPDLRIPEYKPTKSFQSSVLKRAVACTMFSDSSVKECNRNLLKIENFMKLEDFTQDQVMLAPYHMGAQVVLSSKEHGFALGGSMSSSLVTAAPIVKEMLTDKRATEGLRKAALKLLDYKGKKTDHHSNLFDDLKLSFIEAGLSNVESENKTWDTLGALAATGPNFAKRWSRHSSPINGSKMNLKNISDNPNAFLLQMIAEAIPQIDTQKSLEQGGKIYSLPTKVTFNCDIGKTYHFWMTAYLARRLVHHGSSPHAAASSSYIANLGYQLNREAFNGSKLKMKDMERFGATENGLRMDLVLAASGAKFGAASTDNKSFPINLDNNLREAMKHNPTDNTPISILEIIPGPIGKSANFVNRLQPVFIYDSMK